MEQRRHLLLLYALLIFVYFSQALLQVITAFQGLLEFSLHVAYLQDTNTNTNTGVLVQISAHNEHKVHMEGIKSKTRTENPP